MEIWRVKILSQNHKNGGLKTAIFIIITRGGGESGRYYLPDSMKNENLYLKVNKQYVLTYDSIINFKCVQSVVIQ